MGNERIDEDPIQMQPVLSMTPKDVQQELDSGHPTGHHEGAAPVTTDGHHDGGAIPTN